MNNCRGLILVLFVSFECNSLSITMKKCTEEQVAPRIWKNMQTTMENNRKNKLLSNYGVTKDVQPTNLLFESTDFYRKIPIVISLWQF